MLIIYFPNKYNFTKKYEICTCIPTQNKLNENNIIKNYQILLIFLSKLKSPEDKTIIFMAVYDFCLKNFIFLTQFA